MRVAKETHKFLIGGVCAESAKKMKFFFSPYLTEEFPIWWYTAPRIINTFLESYDFSGRKIILFATSGGSGFGKTKEDLKASISEQATIVEGRLLNGKQTKESLQTWVESLEK